MSITLDDKARRSTGVVDDPKIHYDHKHLARTDIVDAHGHIMEPFDFWDEYLDPEFKGRGIRLVEKDGVECLSIDGVVSPFTTGVGGFMGGAYQPYPDLADGKFRYMDTPPSQFDADARVKFLDEEGISKTTIIASSAQLWGAECRDPVLNRAYVKAFNRWIVDWCAPHKDRLYPIGFLPVVDIDASVEEVKRAAKNGVHGFLMIGVPLNNIGFWDKAYDPLWAAIQDADIPCIFHPAISPGFYGANWITGNTGGLVDDRYLLYFESFGLVVDVLGAFAQMLQGGVFDRFPKLKVIMLESGAGWMLGFLERHDTKYKRVWPRSPLKMLPSEYFQRQCWIGAEPEESTLPFMVDKFGADRFLWGTDFAHWDCLPGTLDSIKKGITGLSEKQQAEILGGNARTVYKMG